MTCHLAKIPIKDFLRTVSTNEDGGGYCEYAIAEGARRISERIDLFEFQMAFVIDLLEQRIQICSRALRAWGLPRHE